MGGGEGVTVEKRMRGGGLGEVENWGGRPVAGVCLCVCVCGDGKGGGHGRMGGGGGGGGSGAEWDDWSGLGKGDSVII
jgi:hypothetical protein